MSFPTRRFKPKISRVRSSHSSVRQPVKISRCPQLPIASTVVLDNYEISIPLPTTSKRSGLPKKDPRKKSPPKSKAKPTSGLGKGDNLLTDDFLEEMKKGLDEMGEKLKKVEHELAGKKVVGRSPSKFTGSTANVGKIKSGPSRLYDPSDFADKDVEAAPDDDDSYEDVAREATNKTLPKPNNFLGGSLFGPANEAVENVIAKIRTDINNWRISRGIVEDTEHREIHMEPSVAANGRGEIVVREEAERETSCQSNR